MNNKKTLEELDDGPVCVLELLQRREIDWPFKKVCEEREQQYRIGFTHGYAEAADNALELKKGGFVRTQEITNILQKHLYSILYPWRYRVCRDFKLSKPGWDCGHPAFKHEAWAAIRQRVIARDRKCLDCGSLTNLEAHHLNAVKDGGLPQDSNLITLCEQCHKSY